MMVVMNTIVHMWWCLTYLNMCYIVLNATALTMMTKWWFGAQLHQVSWAMAQSPRQRVHWAQNCCTAWISIAQITIAQNPCAQIAKQIILVTNILPLAINLTHCSNWLGYCDIKSDVKKNSKNKFQSKTLKDTHQMLSGIVIHPTNQIQPGHLCAFPVNVIFCQSHLRRWLSSSVKDDFNVVQL